jgi:hypothetical protein
MCGNLGSAGMRAFNVKLWSHYPWKERPFTNYILSRFGLTIGEEPLMMRKVSLPPPGIEKVPSLIQSLAMY